MSAEGHAAMVSEERDLEVQRSLGRLEAAVGDIRASIDGLRIEIREQVAVVDRRAESVRQDLVDHTRDEADFRRSVEAKALAKTSNRFVLISGILGSGALSWFLTWVFSGHK